MKRVMKLAKSVPWAFMGRLSFKVLCFVWVISATIILLVVKFLALLSTSGRPNDYGEDELPSPYTPGARIKHPELPDLPPY